LTHPNPRSGKHGFLANSRRANLVRSENGVSTTQFHADKELIMMTVRLNVAAVVALFVFAAPRSTIWNPSGQAQAADNEAGKLAKDLIGTWALAGAPRDEKEPPAKGGRFKFITNKNWTITEADPETGVVVFHHGGTFTLDGEKYNESIEYANESTKDLIGKTFHFKIKVEGDTLTQEGIDNSFNEIWKRVK
jgi:hypothetical protein